MTPFELHPPTGEFLPDAGGRQAAGAGASDAIRSRLRRLGQSGRSIVPIIAAGMRAWYLPPLLFVAFASLAGCATAAPQKLSMMWLPQKDYVGTCALLQGATVTPEGCVTRSKTGCTIVTPAKQVSYDLIGLQVRECLR